MEAARLPSGFGWKLIIFRPKSWELILQQIELGRVIHVDAYQFARPIPETFRQGPSIGDRLMEMNRRYMKTVALPKLKDLAKLSAMETTRQDSRDELRKFQEIDVPAHYFHCQQPQSMLGGLTLHFHLVESHVALANGVDAEVIFGRLFNPGNFDAARLSPAHKLFVASRRRNTKLRSAWIV